MTISTDFLVRKDDLRTTEVHETPLPALADGQVLLRIESFALTANNITYGVVGEQLAYWQFFPAPEGWGRIPVWGHAVVEESRHPEIAAGERVYGYLPMSTHLVVEPGKVAAGLFRDMAAHRQPMSAVYNQYRRLAADPAHDPAHEGERMLFEPLFLTSFLIEHMFRSAGFFGAEAMILTSASSKTAMALAHVARAASPQVQRIGLTSRGNIAFVTGTGLYDRVIAYDEIDRLDPDMPAVSVDFAGNGKVLSAIHDRLGDTLKYSCLVGVTHWEGRGLAEDIAGPKPILFFAPHHAEALIGEIGAEGFQKAVAERWRAFVRDAAGWVTVKRGAGADDVARVYQATLAGEAHPETGHVLSL